MDCRFLLLCFLALVAAQNSSNTTSQPLACINGPRSNCTASWLPRNLTLNVGQLTNLTLALPCLPVLSYSLSWATSSGIGVAVGSLTNTSVILAVQDLAGNGGNFTVFVEWCDASGYGNRSTTVKVITTNATTLACINGPKSTCTNNLQPLTETVNVGQIKNVTFNLPCLPVLQYAITWSASNGTGATAGLFTNTSVSLGVQDVLGNGGTITVYIQWCDKTGYGNKSTTVTLIPNRSAVNTTPLACQSSKNVSTCVPVFQSVISPMNAGQTRNFTFTFPANCSISIFRSRVAGNTGLTPSATRVGNSSEIVSLGANSNYNGNVTLIAEWCDSKNSYGTVNLTFTILPVATPTATATPIQNQSTPTPTPSTGVSTSGNSPSSGAATLRGWGTGALMGVLLVACVQFL